VHIFHFDVDGVIVNKFYEDEMIAILGNIKKQFADASTNSGLKFTCKRLLADVRRNEPKEAKCQNREALWYILNCPDYATDSIPANPTCLPM